MKNHTTNRFSKQVWLDFLQMSSLILLSIYFVYYSNAFLRDIFFLAPLFLFWKSRRNYFWFAYFFILLNEPGLLFLTRNTTELHRLPFYTILPSMSFSVIDLFVILALIKAFFKGRRRQFIFSKPLRILLFYFVLFSLPVSWVFGTDIPSLANSIRALFYYSIVVSFFWLYDDEREIYWFGYLIVPYLFVIVGSQFYLIATGEQFINLISQEVSTKLAMNSISGEIRPVMRAVLVVFYAFFFGLSLTRNRQFEIFKGFSEVIVLSAFVSFFLSATRSWISISVLSFIVFLLMSDKGHRVVTRFSLVFAVVFVLLYNMQVIDTDYLERNIWERYFPTVQAMFYGSIGETDTFIDRIENDIPKTLTGLKASPVIGVGLSHLYEKHYSTDLGFLNTMLLFGIVGFCLFLYFLVSFYKKLALFSSSSEIDVASRNIFTTLRAVSIGIFLGYCLTWDFFSFHAKNVFFVSTLIGLAEVVFGQEQNRINAYDMEGNNQNLVGVLT